MAAEENVLTPRFYTTDFEEMEQLFGGEWNSKLNQVRAPQAALRSIPAHRLTRPLPGRD